METDTYLRFRYARSLSAEGGGARPRVQMCGAAPPPPAQNMAVIEFREQ